MKRDKLNVFMIRFPLGLFIVFALGLNASAADFPQGLVLQFNFDQMENNGMVVDRSGHGNARVFGAKWSPYGKQGSGCEFFLTNSCLAVANNSSLNLTQATFAVWFKVLKPGSYDRFILDKGMENGFAFGIGGATNGSRLGFTVCNNVCVGDGPVADGQWHHGAATCDGESLKLYVDGKLQQQVIPWRGEIPPSTNDLVIGMSRSNQATLEQKQSFDGMIDDLMIFNHALSESEVQVVMASVKPKFTREQVAQRLKELKELYDRGLLTKEFYDRKAAECEVSP
jgi:hypothetical protein